MAAAGFSSPTQRALQADDPFSSPSTMNPSRKSGYHQLHTAAAGFSSPTQRSLQADAWLRSSHIHPSTTSFPMHAN